MPVAQMGGLLEKCQLAFALFGLIFFRGKRRSIGERERVYEKEKGGRRGDKKHCIKDPMKSK